MPPRSIRKDSPDYALYEQMLRKSPRASRYWMAGDRLYHAGLFLTMICIPALFYIYTRLEPGGMLYGTVGLLAGSIAVFALGIYLKRESYKLAMKAGIDVTHPQG